MFTDLSGYVAITERLDPEEVAEVVNEIKDSVERTVRAHGGLANQFVGDAVMALFGLPTAEDDDPRRAVAAALAVHERVREIGERFASRLESPLVMHTGIQTGLVIAELRDQRDGVYAVTGDAANTASRLLGHADPDQILVGPDTQHLIAPYFYSELLGRFELRGKAAPILVHRVRGARRDRTRFDAARDLGLTPWTGRAAEMARLDHAYREMVEGRGGLVAVAADAGVGKSRLCHEFLSRIDRDVVAVYQGRCQSFGNVTPYLPFIQAYRSAVGFLEEDSPEEVVARVVENLRGIDPELERYVPVVLHLLSVPSEAWPMPREWQGEELPAAIQQAIVEVDIALSKRRPLILHLEDWHWADESSAAVLVHFARQLAGRRILLLIDHRPGAASGWPEHERLSLTPFDLEDTSALVANCLRSERVQPELIARIQERTLGNPLFVEEICRALEQTHQIERRDGVTCYRGAVSELELPETVQSVIRTRVDKLPPRMRELLRLASVIGREFSAELLERLAPPGWPVAGLLEGLEELEFVQPIPGEGAGRLQFKHVTTQEVSYGTLLQRQRASIHERVAQLIEQLYAGGRIEEHLEALAGHYLEAGDDPRAVHFLERAGAKAEGTFALEQARLHYGRAVERAGALGDDQEVVRRRVKLTLRWADTCLYLPSLSQLAPLERALAEAEALGDEQLVQRVRYWLCWIPHSVGDQTRALPEIDRALALAGPAASDRVLDPLRRLKGQSLLISRDTARGIELLSGVAQALRRAAAEDDVALGGTYAYTMGQLGLLVGQQGDFETGLSHFGEAVDIARKRGLRSTESAVLLTLGLLKTMQGDWSGAIGVARASRVIAEHICAPYQLGTDDVIEGYALFRLGQRDVGLSLLQAGLARLDEFGTFLTKAWSLSCLCHALAELGRHREARQVGEAALARSEFGDRLGEDIAARTLVRVGAAESAARVAEDVDRLLQITRDRGNPREEGLAALCVAEVLADTGDSDSARAPLERARVLLADLDMPYYRDQAARTGSKLHA